MTMQQIRDQYRVPVKRGMVIKFQGQRWTVTSADRAGAYLHIRNAHGQTAMIHPTWEVEYPPFPEQIAAEARVEEARAANREREATEFRAIYTATFGVGNE